jgi:hypothetical protein
MSLSDRLAAAARAREERIGSGAVPAAGRPGEPAPSPASVATVVRAGQRIIAPASTPVDVVTPDPVAAPTSICPTCGRTGELGMVDLPGQTADWSCLSCGTLWQVSLAE